MQLESPPWGPQSTPLWPASEPCHAGAAVNQLDAMAAEGSEGRDVPSAVPTVDATIELEHAIGFAGSVPGSLLYHPNGKDFLYVVGGCIGECADAALRAGRVVGA